MDSDGYQPTDTSQTWKSKSSSVSGRAAGVQLRALSGICQYGSVVVDTYYSLPPMPSLTNSTFFLLGTSCTSDCTQVFSEEATAFSKELSASQVTDQGKMPDSTQVIQNPSVGFF